MVHEIKIRPFPRHSKEKNEGSGVQLDKFDVKILQAIQKNAMLSTYDLGEIVGLSYSPCWRRMKRMEQLGIIKDKVVLLEDHALGLDFHAFVEIKLLLPNQTNMAAFEKRAQIMPEIVQCSAIAGDVDFMLQVVTLNIDSFDLLLRENILSNELVSGIHSLIVVRNAKKTSELPLKFIV